jgi:sigma-B regulation protein RsbU (phosphoserine phosphatase)
MSDIQYKLLHIADLSIEDIVRQYSSIEAEAEEVRNLDKSIIRNLFGNFYNKVLNIGLGFQRAHGSILSGDYFELFKLPDGNYLFAFADISGHGLPAYTSLVRLRCAITMAIRNYQHVFDKKGQIEYIDVVREIGTIFTDVMEAAHSKDFASAIFTFITNEEDKFHLTFFSRGMHFPFVVRKFEKSIVDIYDLNKREKGWIPLKSNLLGAEIRDILREDYNRYTFCNFTVYEGDAILFYSDGLTEATASDDKSEEYGNERLMQCLHDHLHLYPQAIINAIFEQIYEFMGTPKRQYDDMTALYIDFPLVRNINS